MSNSNRKRAPKWMYVALVFTVIFAIGSVQYKNIQQEKAIEAYLEEHPEVTIEQLQNQ